MKVRFIMVFHDSFMERYKLDAKQQLVAHWQSPDWPCLCTTSLCHVGRDIRLGLPD